MKRRTILGVLGALSSSSALALGSGAFGFVRAERGLAVEVTHDDAAYLKLRSRGSGGRATRDKTPEQVKFNFPGVFEDSPGDGIGTNSIYEFDRDAGEGPDGTEGLREIQNQGSNDVIVYSEHETTSDLNIELYDVTDPNKTALRDVQPELEPTERIVVGFRIESFDVGSDTYEETLTIVAEDPE